MRSLLKFSIINTYSMMLAIVQLSFLFHIDWITFRELCSTIVLFYCNKFKAVVHESMDLKGVVCGQWTILLKEEAILLRNILP